MDGILPIIAGLTYFFLFQLCYQVVMVFLLIYMQIRGVFFKSSWLKNFSFLNVGMLLIAEIIAWNVYATSIGSLPMYIGMFLFILNTVITLVILSKTKE